MGVELVAVGEEEVTDVRKSVGFPQVGQNFLLESLQILQNVTERHQRLLVKLAFSYSLEASMTPQNPTLHLLDPRPFHTN